MAGGFGDFSTPFRRGECVGVDVFATGFLTGDIGSGTFAAVVGAGTGFPSHPESGYLRQQQQFRMHA